MLLFCLFICVYIWCNERRKRKTLTLNFQRGHDREARIAYLRQKNLKRRVELANQNGNNGAIYNDNMYDNQQNYHQMEAVQIQQNNVPHVQQQLMNEGR